MKAKLGFKLKNWCFTYQGKIYGNTNTPVNERITNKNKISKDQWN